MKILDQFAALKIKNPTLNNEAIAKLMGIPLGTIKEWRKKTGRSKGSDCILFIKILC